MEDALTGIAITILQSFSQFRRCAANPAENMTRVSTRKSAAVLRMKDSTMETVSKVQEQAGDILADAKAINEARAVEAEAAVIEDAAEETTEETAE